MRTGVYLQTTIDYVISVINKGTCVSNDLEPEISKSFEISVVKYTKGNNYAEEFTNLFVNIPKRNKNYETCQKFSHLKK